MTLTDALSADNELTREETLAYLEEQTQRYLHMPLDEFYRRAEAGTLPDHPAVPHLILMSGARATSC
ncbi:MAG TPA: hypothetical protein VMV02_07980 [Acidimicrobiales bacterium]|nr:hypothetical protein [Acidimicrobiales bacterium]